MDLSKTWTTSTSDGIHLHTCFGEARLCLPLSQILSSFSFLCLYRPLLVFSTVLCLCSLLDSETRLFHSIQGCSHVAWMAVTALCLMLHPYCLCSHTESRCHRSPVSQACVSGIIVDAPLPLPLIFQTGLLSCYIPLIFFCKDIVHILLCRGAYSAYIFPSQS